MNLSYLALGIDQDGCLQPEVNGPGLAAHGGGHPVILAVMGGEQLPARCLVAARAQAGVIKVNRPTAGLDLNVPFGGVKDSSTNTFREQGKSALDFFTWGQTVYTGV